MDCQIFLLNKIKSTFNVRVFERRSFTTVASQKVKATLFFLETASISCFDLSILYTIIRHNKPF